MGTPSPSRPPPNQMASIRVNCPETSDPEVGGSALREMVSAPLHPLEEDRVENILFIFAFVPSLAPPTHVFKKRAISSISWSKEGVVGSVQCVADTLPLPSPSLFASSQWCVVRGCNQAFSHKCCAAHADSTSGHLSASRVESLCSTSLPHPRYVCGSVCPAPQPVSLAHLHPQTRLCDSVCPASAKGSMKCSKMYW